MNSYTGLTWLEYINFMQGANSQKTKPVIQNLQRRKKHAGHAFCPPEALQSTFVKHYYIFLALTKHPHPQIFALLAPFSTLQMSSSLWPWP
jgi:hypothetical protein